MDLWIRSQDGKLPEKAEMLKIAHLHNGSLKEEDFTYSIVVNNDYVFADYKTVERALEVLEEIQSCIQTNVAFDLYSKLGGFYDDFNKKHNVVPVFKMPKE